MLIQTFYLTDYDWDVKVYYAVDRYYISDILTELDQLNIDNYEYVNIKQLLETQKLNIGATYTDYI
jgi:hypothetical protein